jgi:hypothetical protein
MAEQAVSRLRVRKKKAYAKRSSATGMALPDSDIALRAPELLFWKIGMRIFSPEDAYDLNAVSLDEIIDRMRAIDRTAVSRSNIFDCLPEMRVVRDVPEASD